MDLMLLLRMAADGLGDRIALGSRSGGLTYAALLGKVEAAGAKIAAGEARHVAFCGMNSPAFPIALFAAAQAGKPFAPLNYRLPDADLRKLAARTAPGVLIADAPIIPRLAGIDGLEVEETGAFAAQPAEAATESDIDPEAIAILLFTSGTTGEPKAAVLRHQHLASYVVQTVEFMGADEDEATLVSVPPYHIAGVSAVLSSIYAGRRIVQLAAFTPEAWVALARDEAVTHAMVVPTMLGRILDVLQATGERLPALRHLSYGGGRMPPAVIERAMTVMPQVDYVNAYGLTETSSTISVLDAQDHRAAFGGSDDQKRRLGSVGRPLPSLEVEIRGPEGEAVGPGEGGEIWVRGEQVSGEYLERRAIRDDGWLPTNDAGWMDADGYLYVEGRLDDVIVRGGENISPGEVEDVLRAHPSVREVAVLGLPDDEWGEKIVAVVVLKGEVADGELKSWAKERLRSTKAPEQIHVRAELPYNEMGKLLRRELRRELAEKTPA